MSAALSPEKSSVLDREMTAAEDAVNSISASSTGAVVAATTPISEAGQGGPLLEEANSSVGLEADIRRWSDVASDYVQLTKPRIVVMILVTTIATALIGADGLVAGGSMLWLLFATAAVAGSAGAANQIWERQIDRNMTRTAMRPLPADRISLHGAIGWTTLLGVGGTLMLYAGFGIQPALAGAVTWLLYVLAYTPLKTRTSWNTSVGAVAGALPMLIGYTAMGGSLTQWTPWLLVGVLVAWQYPHFMSIAWMYRRQYAEAGFCMSTTVEPTGKSAGWQSVLGSVALVVFGVALCFRTDASVLAYVGSLGIVASTWPMFRESVRFLRQRDDGNARRLLRSSLMVLPLVLLIVTLRVFW